MSEPTEMYVCEIGFLILHPGQLYRFIVHPTCEGCKRYLGLDADRRDLNRAEREWEQIDERNRFRQEGD